MAAIDRVDFEGGVMEDSSHPRVLFLLHGAKPKRTSNTLKLFTSFSYSSSSIRCYSIRGYDLKDNKVTISR